MNDSLGNFFYYTICTSLNILTTNDLVLYSDKAKIKTIHNSLAAIKYNLNWKVHYE